MAARPAASRVAAKAKGGCNSQASSVAVESGLGNSYVSLRVLRDFAGCAQQRSPRAVAFSSAHHTTRRRCPSGTNRLTLSPSDNSPTKAACIMA